MDAKEEEEKFLVLRFCCSRNSVFFFFFTVRVSVNEEERGSFFPVTLLVTSLCEGWVWGRWGNEREPGDGLERILIRNVPKGSIHLLLLGRKTTWERNKKGFFVWEASLRRKQTICVG